MPHSFLMPADCIKDGYLTQAEATELQAIADKHQTTIFVVGSRARGGGRNINSQMPVGKGANTRSDIDVRIDSQKDIDTGGKLSNDIANASNGAGKSMNLTGKEADPPAIIFRPKDKASYSLYQLSAGDNVSATRLIPAGMINNWKFTNECGFYGGGFVAGTTFLIAEINKVPGNIWVRLKIPGSSPVQYLKVSGGEFSSNFRIK
jgi:hypothetical protein